MVHHMRAACPTHGRTKEAITLYVKHGNGFRKKAVACKLCEGVWIMGSEPDEWTFCTMETKEPLLCPRCKWIPKDLQDLLRHYSTHVLSALERHGLLLPPDVAIQEDGSIQ